MVILKGVPCQSTVFVCFCGSTNPWPSRFHNFTTSWMILNVRLRLQIRHIEKIKQHTANPWLQSNVERPKSSVRNVSGVLPLLKHHVVFLTQTALAHTTSTWQGEQANSRVSLTIFCGEVGWCSKFFASTQASIKGKQRPVTVKWWMNVCTFSPQTNQNTNHVPFLNAFYQYDGLCL